MGFSEKQRLVLSTAWKLGHLTSSENYATIAEVTGLSRKQISNWARNQINRLGSKSMPKNNGQLISIYNQLPENMRTYKDYLAFLAPQLASELSAKREKNEVVRTKSRFTAQQRKVLITAWDRGFLLDHKNYANLSQITGLSRKQISNWARMKIHRCGEGNLPDKNTAPISTIFAELYQSLEDVGYPFKHEKLQQLKVEPVQYKQKYEQATMDIFSTSPVTSQELPLFPSKCPIKLKKSGHVPLNLPPPVLFQKPTFENLNSLGYGVPTMGYNSQRYTLPGAPRLNMEPNSTVFLTQIKDWILQHALQGVNEVDDRRIEALSFLVCIANDEIIFYLLHHGWYTRPARKGMRYVRIGSTSF